MDDSYTVDDRSLLRAIEFVDRQSKTTSDVASTSLVEHIVDRPQFQILKDNQHLRELLRAFLLANIRVAHIRNQLSTEQSKGWFERLANKSKRERLQLELNQLEPLQNESFNAYEMLRKLTDIENYLLRRILA